MGAQGSSQPSGHHWDNRESNREGVIVFICATKLSVDEEKLDMIKLNKALSTLLKRKLCLILKFLLLLSGRRLNNIYAIRMQHTILSRIRAISECMLKMIYYIKYLWPYCP